MADREDSESAVAEEYSPTVSTATSPQSDPLEEFDSPDGHEIPATPTFPAQSPMENSTPYMFMVDSPLLERSDEDYAPPRLSISADQPSVDLTSPEPSVPIPPMSEHSPSVVSPGPPPGYQYHTTTLPPLPRTQPRPHGPRTTRDQRIEILLMRRLGHTYDQISKFLGISIASVTYTCQKKNPQPLHNLAGRRPRISEAEVDRLVAYVANNRRDKKLTHAGIAKALWPDGDVSVETIKYNLHKRSVRLR